MGGWKGAKRGEVKRRLVFGIDDERVDGDSERRDAAWRQRSALRACARDNHGRLRAARAARRNGGVAGKALGERRRHLGEGNAGAASV